MISKVIIIMMMVTGEYQRGSERLGAKKVDKLVIILYKQTKKRDDEMAEIRWWLPCGLLHIKTLPWLSLSKMPRV